MGNITSPIEFIENKTSKINITNLYSSINVPEYANQGIPKNDNSIIFNSFFSANDEYLVTYSLQSLEVWDMLKINMGLNKNILRKYRLDIITNPLIQQNLMLNDTHTFITDAFSSKYTISFAINSSATKTILLYKANTFEYVLNLSKEFKVLEEENIENLKISSNSKYLVILTTSEISVYDLLYNDNNNINPSYKAELNRRVYSIKQKIENFHTKHNFIISTLNKICIVDDHVGLLNDFIINVKEDKIELLKGFYTNKTLTSLCFSQDETVLATGSEEGEILAFEIRSKKKQNWLEKTNHSITSLCFSKDNKYLAYGDNNGTVGVLNCKLLKLVTIYKFNFKHQYSKYCKIKCLSYSNNYLSISVSELGSLIKDKVSNFTTLTRIDQLTNN